MNRYTNAFASISTSLLTLMVTSACGSDKDIAVPEAITVNNDEASMAERVRVSETPIETIPAEGTTQLTGLISSLVNLLLVADIDPPSLPNGVKAQANHIAMNGSSVAVAYNVAGDTQAGAVDIFTVAGILTTMISEIKFNYKDVNGVFFGKTAIYATGADSENGASAFLTRIPFDSSLKMSSTVTSTKLTGYAGTSVYSNGTTVYATSGDNGELATFNATTLVRGTGVSLFDARAVGYSSNSQQIFAFSGQPGTLSTFTKAGALVSSKVVGGATTAQSKSTIQVGDAMSLVTQGAGGFSIVCNATGAVVGSAPAVTVTGKDPAKTVTNGASIYKNLVFTANGEAGVYVYVAAQSNNFLPTTTCQPITLTQAGYLSLGDGFSANALKFYNNNLVVASGTGGLKVISLIPLTSLTSVIGGESNELEP
ncbi:MAG: hypothetical protein EOP10_21715 [Proteobacteria bacterium]|nr:MAG: hypothetical protein EOP10_21715 [Pseudomonadota bacterium]